MRRLLPAFVTALCLFAADNPWAKVLELKSRQELKVYKKGGAEPIAATLDEATEERLLLVVKNKQTSIAREDIDRIDARPLPKAGSKATVQTTAKQNDPDYTPRPNAGPAVPSTSSSSSLSFGKPEFETIYRRPRP